MIQIEQLLRYQEEDTKLLEIEKELAASKQYKLYKQANSFIAKASVKLEQLEAKAKEYVARLAQLNGKYEELCEVLDDLDNLDDLVESGADVSFYKKNASSIIEQLKALKAEIEGVKKAAAQASKEYEELKQNTIAMQRQRKAAAKEFEELKASYQTRVDEIKAKLDELEKLIDKELLEKYKNKRKEKIFPILCKQSAGRCSKCGTELSISGQEIINSKGAIECEHCLRIIYK